VTAEDVLLGLFEAINDRDLDRLESLHADEYELVDEATGEVFRGPAGARRNNEGWLHAFPDLRWEPTNSIARGDWACVEVIGRGTHSGSLQTEGGEAPPTGRSFEIAVVTIARAENGRLVEGRDYYDRAGFLVRLGVLPERIGRS
jgi:ketosteroid isomerase-like protein